MEPIPWSRSIRPLARVAVAIGPYLSGLRLAGNQNLWIEGNQLLLAHGRYLHNLSLARLGVLPFFLLATFLVWYWARARYGDGPALVATFLFTTSPVVLAHAGLATTDMALTATFTAALLAYINFLEKPTYVRAAIFGVATALAILSKFSALVFLPACGFTLLLTRWLMNRRTKEKSTARRPHPLEPIPCPGRLRHVPARMGRISLLGKFCHRRRSATALHHRSTGWHQRHSAQCGLCRSRVSLHPSARLLPGTCQAPL